MINKILGFNEKKDILFKRKYAETLEDEKIIKLILENPNSNFLDSEAQIIYQKYETFYIAAVAEDENDFLILEFIELIYNNFKKIFENVTETVLLYNFKASYLIVDSLIINGKLVSKKIDKDLIDCLNP